MCKWTILEWARHYASLGWSIIPLRPRTKKPAVASWKPYQTARASDAELVEWFSQGKYDLGVVLGAVSGNLACRDFDNAEAYQQWKAEHPELANRLPVVKTGRGYHVYFRTGRPCATRSFDDGDGELRGEGAYTVLPPSMHQTGVQYQWLTELDLLSEIPIVDPTEAGLAPCNIETQNHRILESEQLGVWGCVEAGCLRPVQLDALEPDVQQAIVQAITKTLPKAAGQRYTCLFRFARILKGILGRDVEPLYLKPLVMHWHQLAEANMSGNHTCDDSWQEFSVGWARIYLPGDGDIVKLVLERLSQGVHPVCAAMHYASDTAVVAMTCAILQDLRGDQPFYLSGPLAAKILDAHRAQLPEGQRYRQRCREWCWRAAAATGDRASAIARGTGQPAQSQHLPLHLDARCRDRHRRTRLAEATGDHRTQPDELKRQRLTGRDVHSR